MTDLQPAIPGLDLDLGLGPVGPTSLDRYDTPALIVACARLANLDTASRWTLGDCALELVDRLGTQGLVELAAQGHHQATLSQAMAVSDVYPSDRRRPGLSWSHHQTAATMCPGQPTGQDQWLDRALRGDDGRRWSARRLRDEIAAARDRQPQLPGTETLPRPPATALRAALDRERQVMWVPGSGQLSAARVLRVDVVDGHTIAAVEVDAAMAAVLEPGAAA